jgi:hypothetical protein
VEIRYVNTDNSKAPVSGNAIYVVLEESQHRVSLFYPWTLTEFTLPQDEYVKGQGKELWPDNQTDGIFDIKKVVQMLERKIEFDSSLKKNIPRVAFRCLAAMTGKPVSEIEKTETFVMASAHKTGTSREIRQYQLAKKIKLADFKGRRREILEVLSHGPATVTAISDGITYVPKLKVQQDLSKAKEREVLWVLRQDFIRKGLVKVVG